MSRRQAPFLRPWPAALIVAGLTVAAFLSAVWTDFVNWDDDRNLVDNPAFGGLGWRQLQWIFATTHMGH